jgi:hypothetical protein
VDQKDRYLRQLLIADIEEQTGRELIVYYTDCSTLAQIEHSDLKYFSELLGGCEGKNVDLLLETNGGEVDATEMIVSLLCNQVGNLRVFVPRRAKSSGTVVALASHEVVMGPNSELGPIDPMIRLATGFVPAEFILKADPKEVNSILKLHAEYAVKQIKKLATTVLRDRMLSSKTPDELAQVVDMLASREFYHSHGSVVDHREALRLGLRAVFLKPEDELWKRIWLLRCMLEQDCQQGGLQKIFEGRRISSAISRPKA